MSSILSIIQSGLDALEAVTPQSLTVDQISSSKEKLDAINVNDTIDSYRRSLPAKPDNDDHLPAWETEMRKKASEINHELRRLNEELNRIKSIRETLSLDYLDPLIKSAQQIIRPLYNFTAQLNY